MKIEAAAIMDGPPAGMPPPPAGAEPAVQPGELFAALLDLAAGAACAPIADAPQQAETADEPAGAGPAAGDHTTQVQPQSAAPAALFPCPPFSPIVSRAPGDRADRALASEVQAGEPSAAPGGRALREQDPGQPPPAIRAAQEADLIAAESVIIPRREAPGRAPAMVQSPHPDRPTTVEPDSAPVRDARGPEEPARSLRTSPHDRPTPGGDPAHGAAVSAADADPEAVPRGDTKESATIAQVAVVLPVLSPAPAAPMPFAGAVAAEPIRRPAVGENVSDTRSEHAERHRQESGTICRVASAKEPPSLQSLAGPDVAILRRESAETRPPGDSRPPEAAPETMYEARSGSADSQRPAEKTAQHAAKIAEREWIPGSWPHPAPDPAPAAAPPASREQPAILAPGFAGTNAPAITATVPAGTGRPSLPAQAEIVFSEIDFLPRLAEQVYVRVREGSNVIRIQLRPGGLGRMEIRAECSGPSMSAAILTESSWVRTYVEQNLAALYQNLQDLGLKVDRLVVLEDAWARHPSAQQGDHGSRPQDERGRELHPRSWPEPEKSSTESPAGLVSSIYVLRGRYSTFHAVA